jgi:hypothetical protein
MARALLRGVGMRRTLVLLLPLTACDVSTASNPSDLDYEAAVLHRATIEFPCASSAITVTEIDHTTYLAEGCGYRVTYECGLTSDVTACQRVPDLVPVEAGSK